MNDVMGVVQRLHAAGYPTDDIINQVEASFPTADPQSLNDPTAQAAYGAKLHDWIVNTWGSTLPAATQATTFAPHVATQDTGGGVQTYDQNPFTNPGATSLTFGKTLSPADAASQVPGPVGPNGAPTVISRAAYAANNGMGGLVYGGAPAGTGQPPSAPPGGSVFGTGRLPPALLPPGYTGGAGGAQQPGTAAAPAGGGAQQPAPASLFSGSGMGAAPTGPATVAPMITGLGPGQDAALKSAGAEGQGQANALTSAAQDVPMRQSIYDGMLGDLTQASTGPNTGAINAVRGRMVQVLNSLGVQMPAGAEGQAASENFAKLANQMLGRQAAMLGPVTNDKIAVAAESGPNPLFSTLGNRAVIHIAQGNEDALSVKNQAWLNAVRTQGLTGADFQNWSANFNQSFSPSAFWYSRMDPSERQRLIAGMSPQDRMQLQNNIVGAIDRGWIDPATLAPPRAQTPAASPPGAAPLAAPPSAVVGGPFLTQGAANGGY